jgi:hypothetical protein
MTRLSIMEQIESTLKAQLMDMPDGDAFNDSKMKRLRERLSECLELLDTLERPTPSVNGNKYRVVEIVEGAEVRFQIVDNENNPIAARTFKSESAAQRMINNWFGKGFKP